MKMQRLRTFDIWVRLYIEISKIISMMKLESVTC